jgi:hypothetical protein
MMMNFGRIAQAALLVVMMAAASILQADDDWNAQRRIADVLFPQSEAWTRPEDGTHPAREWLTAHRDHLKTAYLAVKDHDNLESADCSFIARALNENLDPKSFFFMTLFPGKDRELVYAGSSLCNEGESTVIWSKAEKPDRVLIMPYRVLRASAGTKPLFTAVQAGCCDDPMDKYVLADVQSPWKDSLPVLSGLEIPPDAARAAETGKSPGVLTLRSSPKRSDAYDPGESEHMASAAFGNILRAYLPGVSVTTLLKFKNSQGAEWRLVRVAEDQRVWSYHTPYGTNAPEVGWVEAACLDHPCEGPKFVKEK